MSARLVCVILALCLCLTASHTQGTARRSSLNRLVGQQPLLFGRRGINPNMNSLFFGKRAGLTGPQPSVEDIRSACTMLMTAYEQVAVVDDNES
uniref:FFamide n=1 Tax=Charonia tritonis TaxID=1960912 RepID=A0A1S6JQ10_9CAEN|nr:FFamide precursor [Charonia tritonis]